MKIKSNLVLRHIGNDYIIIEPDKGIIDMANVYTLNETAAWLWQQLESLDFSVDVIAELLLQRYDIDSGKAIYDAEQLVKSLRENGLLEEK